MGGRTKPRPPIDRRKAPGKTILTTRIVYITRGFALVHCTATLDVLCPVVEFLSRLLTAHHRGAQTPPRAHGH